MKLIMIMIIIIYILYKKNIQKIVLFDFTSFFSLDVLPAVKLLVNKTEKDFFSYQELQFASSFEDEAGLFISSALECEL